MDTGAVAPPVRAEELDTAAHGSTGTDRQSLEVRCPNCRSPIEVPSDASLASITCGACGSEFDLVNHAKATWAVPTFTKLGRFELIDRLGSGSFGTVWKARDQELDRTVAIKTPHQGAMNAEEAEKFFREARAAAQLRHPNIVSVHEVGRDGDSIYIVSDFVRGVTLGDWLSGQTLTAPESATLCVKLAEALHHAHEKGVVHRDLKPSNILLDSDGEPHIMDFGLARREVGEVTLTVDGQVLGTPAYMSPEQAAGESHQADRRSDVYSLGVILFQLLTGELPFRGNPRMMMHQVVHEEAPSPRKFNASVSKDLETITLKCLEKQPSKRYDSAKQFANELNRHLAGEPILARPIGRAERAFRWTRRHKAVSVLSSTVFLALVGGTAVSAYFAIDASQQASIAFAREQDAEQRRKDAEAVTNFLIAAFESPNPKRDGRTITVAEVLDRAENELVKQLPEQPLTRAALLGAIGSSRRGLGLYSAAIGPLTQVRSLLEKELGGAHPQTLSSQNILACAYKDAGRLDEAIALHEETLAALREQFGGDHPDTLGSMNNLANAYYSAGRFDDALPLYVQVLATRRERLGVDHPKTLASRNNLATAYSNAGRLDEAIPLHEETLASAREQFGVNHPDTLGMMSNLASAYESAGRVDEGITLYEQTLAARLEKLGADHPDTLNSMRTLVFAYSDAGRVAEVIRLDEQTQAAQREKLEGNHPDALDYINALANAYDSAGRFAEAIPFHESLVAANREKWGADHAQTIESTRILTSAYGSAGRTEEAIQLGLAHGLFFDALAHSRHADHRLMSMLIEKAVAQDVTRVRGGSDRVVIGELRLLAGHAQSAEVAIRSGLEIKPWSIFNRSLGMSLLAQGKSAEAKQAFQVALKKYRQEDGTFNITGADPVEMTAAYFLDLVSQDEYVDCVKGNELYACLPWFYIGQRKEFEGDMEAAIAAYERGVELGDREDANSVCALARWRLVELKTRPK